MHYCSYTYTDPAYQESVPCLDGGEGCSEFILHGTNVDLSETSAQEQEESLDGRANEEKQETGEQEGSSDLPASCQGKLREEERSTEEREEEERELVKQPNRTH